MSYIEGLVDSYLRIAGRDRLRGRVAEIGPGDNLGTLALLRARGAAEVHAVDRYWTNRDAEHQKPIYQELSRRNGLGGLIPESGDPMQIPGVISHVGIAAEDFFRTSELRFEAIFSWSVLEHLYDPISALDDMASALVPGGVMVHSVDLRDHEMFSSWADPLTFLRVPAPIYRQMIVARGLPNRVLAHRYRKWLEQSNLRGELRVHSLVGSDENVGGRAWEELPEDRREAALARVWEMRNAHRLAKEFQDVADEDLAVSGIQLVVHRDLKGTNRVVTAGRSTQQDGTA